MAMGTSLVALAMVAAGEAPAGSGAPICYQAKVLTIEGTAWRSESFHRMRPVARQGTSTIWTADRALAESLAKGAKDSASAPRVLVSDNSSIAQKQTRFYVSHLERYSDGPVNQATRVAFVPEVASLPEGFQVSVTGRRIDQGVLANVCVEDAHVLRIETVGLPEMLKGEPKEFKNGPVDVAQKVLRTVINGSSEVPETSIRGQIQVPEVATGRAQGEWLIPNDSVLIVSLGIHTVADPKGMAVTQERVAIVDFDPAPIKPISTEAFLTGALDGGRTAPALPATVEAGEPMPIALANLPQATPPARSLPEAIDVDGKVVELPPLPEAVASADLNLIGPGSRLASAQTTYPGPMADAALARTSFEGDATAPDPTMAELSSTPLFDFARRLVERMGEYEMDIDVSGDGRSCHISLRDDATKRAAADPSCPPEPRCDNGKETDAELGRTVFFGQQVRTTVGNQALATMKPGDSIDFNIVSGGKAPARLKAPVAEAMSPCPDCDECLKEVDASCPVVKDRAVSVADMAVTKMVDGISTSMAASIDLQSALKNPGTTETTIVPLIMGLSLEIKARVVPTPAAGSKVDGEAQKVAFVPKRTEELLQSAEQLRKAVGEFSRFWFLGRPGDMKPFKVESDPDR